MNNLYLSLFTEKNTMKCNGVEQKNALLYETEQLVLR